MDEPKNAWGVYILRCRDGSLYTGVTTDLSRRVQQHNTGKGARYTRARAPVSVVFWEPGHSRSSALVLEAAIKRMPRRDKRAAAAFRLR